MHICKAGCIVFSGHEHGECIISNLNFERCKPKGQATLKKKFVSCPAGGPNHGYSGGRKHFLFSFLFFFLARKLLIFFFGGGGGGGGKEKN